MTETEITTKLNTLLKSTGAQHAQSRILSPDAFEESIALLNKFHKLPLLFDEEQTRDPNQFSRTNKDTTQAVKLCQLQIDKIRLKREEAVKNENFEQAAQLRDEEKKVKEQIKDELIIGNNFNEGFNVFHDRLLVVWPQDVNQKEVLKKILEGQKAKQTGTSP